MTETGWQSAFSSSNLAPSILACHGLLHPLLLQISEVYPQCPGTRNGGEGPNGGLVKRSDSDVNIAINQQGSPDGTQGGRRLNICVSSRSREAR